MLKPAARGLVFVCLAWAGPALAGSSNTLYLSQTTDHGNVANVDISNSCPVNSLTCSTISLTQDNSVALAASLQSLLPLDPNTARIVITGVGDGAVTQLGGGNHAALAVWDGGQGTITQSGLENSATLTLRGNGNSSSVNQSGPNNSAVLDVTATALGAGVHLTQLGNDSTTATVFTNVSVSYTRFVP